MRAAIHTAFGSPDVLQVQEIAPPSPGPSDILVEVRASAVTQGDRRLRAADFDLVLMDCQMPVMDGCQATRLVRDPASSVRDPAIPILALTANAMEGDREKCLAAGMDDHVAKPVRREELAEALERWRRRPSEAPRG
jgi:CheY-like chemotaxis protein